MVNLTSKDTILKLIKTETRTSSDVDNDNHDKDTVIRKISRQIDLKNRLIIIAFFSCFLLKGTSYGKNIICVHIDSHLEDQLEVIILEACVCFGFEMTFVKESSIQRNL